MIPLAIPQMAGREGEYLQQCVETNMVSSVGSFVTQFEEMVATASGGQRAIATSAGTTGIHAALAAVGVGQGDLVILPSFTFIASANAIAHCGALPWLFDIDPDSWTLNVAQLADALATQTSHRDGKLYHIPTGRRVGAILPVYTLGMPADMDSIVDIARQFGLPVVADSAAALGALYRDRMSADLGADLSVYSFNGNKTVTAGGGGAVVGNDPGLVERVRHLTTTARVGADYTHDAVGFNYRMTNLQAAVGCAQLEKLDEYVAVKRRVAAQYTKELTQLDGIASFPSPDWADSACWFSGVTVDPKVYGLVDDLRDKLRADGIDARPFWKPVHLQAPYKNAPCEDQKVAASLWQRVLTLPCSTSLTEADQAYVIERTAFRLTERAQAA